MDDAEKEADETGIPTTSIQNDESEAVWSVGDRCMALWSGDNTLYRGMVKKLRHLKTGKVVALVKFDAYDSDDCEEVDVRELSKVGEKVNKNDKAVTKPSESVGGIFQPFTGKEENFRLEEKYGRASDSDEDVVMTGGSNIVSPTPYETKGKMSEWKMKSPVKGQMLSQRRKVAVAVGGSPRKKRSPKKTEVKKLSVQKTGPSSELSSTPQAEATASAEKNNAHGTDKDVTPSTSHLNISGGFNGDGLFEGFDEDDMEKPNFSFTPPSDKAPFALSSDGTVQIPAPLNQYLRDYQREGIKFLYSHYANNQGAILGDDMGLGKTVQVIGFLSSVAGKQGNRVDVMRQRPRFIRMMSSTPDDSEGKKCRPFLIIGPGSVLYNWLEELETWAHFTVRKYHGSDKAVCLADVLRGKVEVVVTTFETCRDNIDDLNRVKWEAVIADEVHRIKGMKAQTTIALRQLKCKRRYGLTGTALQNKMSELWCILDWAQPNVLGSAEDFEEDFVHPIELGQKENATKRELAEARKKKEEFSEVRSKMLLRRTKKIIADQLPTKTDRVVFCRLSPLQVDVYRSVLAHKDLQQVVQSGDPCVCGSGLTRGKCCFKKLSKGRSAASVMFTFLHVLLKTSNHVALLTPHARMSPDQEQQSRKLCDIAFKEHKEFLGLTREAAFRTLSDPQYCGKMKILHGMLSVFAKSHSKVLIFSYSTRLLDILEQHVISVGFEFRRIDGTVTGRRRQEIVKEFNTNPDIFLCLVSTKAGGLGLNMTGANKVVIFDPNWNPSHDLQAQDRAYRIGQRRDVEVYRLVSAGSIEENIYLRQIYKQQLDMVAIGTQNARRYFQGIQGDAENKGELFGIKNMFQLRTGDSCLTMDILNRHAHATAQIAGCDMADYIPSWEEQQRDREAADTDDEEEGEGGDDGSSDDDSLEVFRDLFADSVSDDETQVTEAKTPQSTSRKRKQQPTPSNKNGEPQPSTSGLQRPSTRKPGAVLSRRYIDTSGSDVSDSEIKKSKRKVQVLPYEQSSQDSVEEGTSRSKGKGLASRSKGKGLASRSKHQGHSVSRRHASRNSDSDISDSEQVASKRTTRLRQHTGISKNGTEGEIGEGRKNKSGLNGRETAADVLDFLDDDDAGGRVAGKGKALITKRPRTEVSKTRSGVHSWTKRVNTRGVTDEDSLVTPSFSSISSVFEKCGVIHVHDNPQVVGGSRVEDHISRCAMQDVFELRTNTQAPALLCDPMSQPSEEEPETAQPDKKNARGKGRSRGRTPAKDHNSAKTVDHAQWHIVVGQTPNAIRRKHWKQLQEHAGVTDSTALAHKILAATAQERLDMLKEMYKRRHGNDLHPALDDILSIPPEPPEEREDRKTLKKTSTPSVKTKPVKKGGKKKGGATTKTPAKKQQPPQRKKGPARGLFYDNDDDTEQSPSPQKRPHHGSDLDVSDDSSDYDVGAKVSPVKSRGSPMRKRILRKGQRSRSVTPAKDTATLEQTMTSRSRKVPVASKQRRAKGRDPENIFSLFDDDDDDNDNDTDNVIPPSQSLDVDGLIKELGKKTSNPKPDNRRKEPPIKRKSDESTRLSGVKKAKASGPSVPGKKSASSKNKDVASTCDDLSVLDDIFSDPDDLERSRRRPPPSRGKKARKSQAGLAGAKRNSGEGDIFSDLVGERVSLKPSRGKDTEMNVRTEQSSSRGGLCQPSTSRINTHTNSNSNALTSPQPSTSSAVTSPDVFSDLMDDSTLKDDYLDCFGEPSQWKKRKKTPKTPVKNVKKADCTLQQVKNDYLQLFESGRLVKKREREAAKDSGKTNVEKDGRGGEGAGGGRGDVKKKDDSYFDPSGSLFD